MIRTIIASAALLALAPAAAPAQQGIDGTYTDSDGYVEIRVGPCGNARCGTITRILKTKPGESNRDRHNDDP